MNQPMDPFHPQDPMKTAAHVVENDLDYIIRQASEEFAQMSGRRLMIAGGAGFLGYYLVQSALHWNHKHADLSRRSSSPSSTASSAACRTG